MRPAKMCIMPRIVTNNGYWIGYFENGGGDDLPIVFLHGVGSDKSVWHPQLDDFGRSRRAVAFDYPGYGESDPAPAGTTRDDYASAIISAMHELGIDRAHICGLSLGGVIAIAINHSDARRCASLILADTFAVHPQGRAIYDRSIAASDDLRAMAEARVDMLLAQPANPKVRREVVETMARIDPAAYRIGAQAVWLADQSDRARDVAIPTLVLCGANDSVTPPDLSRELNRLIPNSTLEIVPAAGHLINLEQVEAFNTLVGNFLGSAEAPAQE